MRRMKTAIVGCGSISDAYIQSIQSRFSVLDLCACADLDISRMEQTAEKYGLRAMSMDAIAGDPEIQLVINLTPPKAHYPVTKTMLEHGKHVYSEKMLAVDFAQGLELCEIAKKHQVRLGCAPDTFLGGGLQTVREAIDRGLIGKITSGIASFTKDDRVIVANLPHLYSHGGTILFDMGSYYLTALCSLLGPVEELVAFGSKSAEAYQVNRVGSRFFGQAIPLEDCDILTASLKFAGGAQVMLHFNAATRSSRNFMIFGDSGAIELGDPNRFGSEQILRKPDNEPVALPLTHGFQKPSRGLGAAEMVWSIYADRPHRASMEMACHVLEIANGIFRSIESHGVYTMTTAFEKPEPLPGGYIGEGFWAHTEESAII